MVGFVCPQELRWPLTRPSMTSPHSLLCHPSRESFSPHIDLFNHLLYHLDKCLKSSGHCFNTSLGMYNGFDYIYSFCNILYFKITTDVDLIFDWLITIGLPLSKPTIIVSNFTPIKKCLSQNYAQNKKRRKWRRSQLMLLSEQHQIVITCVCICVKFYWQINEWQ